MSEKDIETTFEGKGAYELAFHLVPSLGDDKVDKAFDEVIKLVEKNKGKVVSKSEPALLNLEYTMEKTVDSVKSKYNTAYFAWVIFENGDVQKISENLEQYENILRFLLIKTDQKDSIKSSEVAAILDGEEDEEEKVVQKEEEKVVQKEEEEEVKEEKVEEPEDKKEDDKKVDEAIDELVK